MGLSSHRARAEARLVGWAALDGAVMLTCWTVSALGPWWMFLVMAPVVGGRLHALGVLLHDACHLPGRSGWTWLLEALGGWPVGTTLESMRAHHLRHHARTNAPDDPYFAPRRTVGDGRLFFLMLGIFPFWVARAVLGVASFGVPRLKVAYAALLVSGEDDAAGQRDVERARRAEWPVLVTWGALGALTVMEPSLMARAWWLPLSWAALFNACRFLAEHSRAPQQAGLLETTRDVTCAWLTPFVFPHHVGLHRTHHRFPTASWETLPRLRSLAALESASAPPAGQGQPEEQAAKA